MGTLGTMGTNLSASIYISVFLSQLRVGVASALSAHTAHPKKAPYRPRSGGFGLRAPARKLNRERVKRSSVPGNFVRW